MRVFVVRNVPHLRPFIFKIGPILRPPQCDVLFKLIRPFVSLPSFKQNLAVNCELKVNIKTLFETLFRMHSSNKSSNVYTLCYSMIHFVYTHVIVTYNFGKK